MTGKIQFQFFVTFLMGALTGAFLYVTAFAPSYKKDTQTQMGSISEGMIIEGEMYGGCSELDSCASFRLLENARYDYIPYPDAQVEHGKLPSAIHSPLFDALTDEAVARAGVPTTSDACDSYVDGLDFSYTLMTASSTSELDTCSTLLHKDENLQALFLDAWDFMQNPTTTYPAILEEGPGGFIIDKAFERFHEGEQKTQE
jgi:hypothetical protein